MNFLNRLVAEMRRHKFATPLFLLVILAMIILPLPPVLLDILFTFNIVLALIVILVSVSAKRPLDFSVFPTVILATTMLRLTLNVASTRVVLLHGHTGADAAGKVIEAFGNVVIGGNFVVGIVVFVILMIINFAVVTKGAERISEVSARFTLDALPGKQMAIDADLNAGLINQEKAQIRRKDVAAEADFYGAMDGASKFVRGDAVASILILIINMVGGVAIGSLMHDLSFGDAFRQYALLTIGDGLVAQIPALLLSAAAAILVTRISDSGDFEQQVAGQVLTSPTVIFSAAGMMVALALIPGMPWFMFMTFAAVLAFVAWRLTKRVKGPDAAGMAAIEAALREERPAELEWQQLPAVQPLMVMLGYKLVGMVDKTQGEPLNKRVKGVRQSLSEAMGLLLPNIGVRDDLALKPSQYAIVLSGTVVAQAEVQADRLMAIPSPNVYGQLDGIPGIEPAYGMPVTWIEPSEKAHALGLGYQVIEAPSVIATHLSKMVREYLPELFRHEDVSNMMERLTALSPKLAGALDKALTHTQLLRVFRVLLAENVSLKDIVPIATTLLDSSETTKDPILLAAEVRCALRRQIVSGLFGQKMEMQAFNLGGELENMLLGSLNQARQAGKVTLDNYPIDPHLLSQLQVNMPVAREQMKQQATPPLLLVLPQIRPLLARYARLFAPGLHVLSYNEIPENREVSIIGTVG
ncbi:MULTISPECIES: flagellar biosynthesis protein FlhA [unclassified Janthinobacterium]|uniref:flagellar biosynthesis protein FlhA n=1 Tax=unclassified Janthinobacterium TaxID=2610881 RepID=UPI000C1686D8|nr:MULTISPECIES: flagellar biosynthesis protein FlhA [unclassified Janthinobacterium]MDN2714649.1 flagellar biosynthesis protein FlhA [Janthinobacterium sp. SUN120]MDO8040521.1 flagellar biosynthesis protein FlhA [Janthinobacterium sp. SUN137]MED5612237.1 flagellar biosynthesis protein FlhA [Janthinobacterium sp. P210005]PIF08427.1 flagellar biosynthesis protein FlhA [Janthinobacterium sp. 13]